MTTRLRTGMDIMQCVGPREVGTSGKETCELNVIN
jgi:hypothetical protein